MMPFLLEQGQLYPHERGAAAAAAAGVPVEKQQQGNQVFILEAMHGL